MLSQDDTDPRMKEIFQNKIRIGYRRNKNLREILFRSRLYKVRPSNIDRPLRTKKGWKTCAKCLVCLNSENRQEFTCHATKEVFKIDKFITCKTRNVIYICECARCGLQSVGKTSQTLQARGVNTEEQWIKELRRILIQPRCMSIFRKEDMQYQT